MILPVNAPWWNECHKQKRLWDNVIAVAEFSRTYSFICWFSNTWNKIPWVSLSFLLYRPTQEVYVHQTHILLEWLGKILVYSLEQGFIQNKIINTCFWKTKRGQGRPSRGPPGWCGWGSHREVSSPRIYSASFLRETALWWGQIFSFQHCIPIAYIHTGVSKQDSQLRVEVNLKRKRWNSSCCHEGTGVSSWVLSVLVIHHKLALK